MTPSGACDFSMEGTRNCLLPETPCEGHEHNKLNLSINAINFSEFSLPPIN